MWEIMGIGTTLRRMLGRDGRDRPEAADEIQYEFETKNVNETEDYEYAFYGAYGYRDDEGRDHLVEREFDVYTDEDGRVDGLPVARIREDHSVADGPDSEQFEDREFEVPVEVDPGLEGIAFRSGIRAFLEEWHRENAERR